MASQVSCCGGFTARTGYLLAVLAGQLGCSGSVTLIEDAAGAGGSGSSSGKVTSKPSGSGSASSASQGGAPDESGGTGSGGTTPTSTAGAPPAAEQTQYPGHGFVVHEWGTDTIVVGSDGSLQRGLHHEEEDLPGFVYDRLKAAPLSQLSVMVKMETPVTYFYSDVPLSAQASVTFPEGLLTQWYPAVSRFAPEIAAPGSGSSLTTPATYADPVLDLSFPFGSDLCRDKFSAVAGGKLDWGTFSLLARGTDVSASQPDAPLAKFGWSYARDVDANPIQMPNGEAERFLFYRGLGDFDFPITVQAGGAGHVALTNGYSQPVGRVFVLNVGAENGAFTEHRAGIAPGATLDDVAPSLDGAPTLDDYEGLLGSAVTDALDATGLYHDEATAMVNTWQRQWFRTPGVRVLYLIPQAWTDASIPLSVTPKPDSMLRVMLIRVEVITPEQELGDVEALEIFDTDSAQAKGHFTALGRFAEPRLRRALSLSPNVAGEAYLSEIRTANTAVATGE
jgi:hypothetical protein